MASTRECGIRHAKVSPKFLHSNSTSHTWAFSAIAELIDNAYDPDTDAKTISIDKVEIKGRDVLIFMDNGNGMTKDKLYDMLSFGYCEKIMTKAVDPIGHYGNGFKSSSMRLGKNALVFTIEKHSMSVGLLSQTYLEEIEADTIVVPIVTWNRQRKRERKDETKEDWERNLADILQHTLFKSEEELMNEFDEVLSQSNFAASYNTGTRILLYDLKRHADGKLELDFESDKTDINNLDYYTIEQASNDRPPEPRVSEIKSYNTSLREYCSILYLKPRLQISLRGKKVKTKYFPGTLRMKEYDKYEPKWLKNRRIKLTFGFNDDENDYGLMQYHKKRLIRAYERVGRQKQGHGVGIVGLAELDLLEIKPNHIKQDFDKTNGHYNIFMKAATDKLNDFITQFGEHERASVSDTDTWIQCDKCNKWRRLPDTANKNMQKLDSWDCEMNPDHEHNRCYVAEEVAEDESKGAGASYEKTVKKERKQQKTPNGKIKQEKSQKTDTDQLTVSNAAASSALKRAGRLDDAKISKMPIGQLKASPIYRQHQQLKQPVIEAQAPNRSSSSPPPSRPSTPLSPGLISSVQDAFWSTSPPSGPTTPPTFGLSAAEPVAFKSSPAASPGLIYSEQDAIWWSSPPLGPPSIPTTPPTFAMISAVSVKFESTSPPPSPTTPLNTSIISSEHVCFSSKSPIPRPTKPVSPGVIDDKPIASSSTAPPVDVPSRAEVPSEEPLTKRIRLDNGEKQELVDGDTAMGSAKITEQGLVQLHGKLDKLLERAGPVPKCKCPCSASQSEFEYHVHIPGCGVIFMYK